MTLNKNLRRFREGQGLTQKELASRAGVHYPSISRYETGVVVPQLPSLMGLAGALEVSLDALVYGPLVIPKSMRGEVRRLDFDEVQTRIYRALHQASGQTSLERAVYRIYVLARADQGLHEARKERTMSEEEAEERLHELLERVEEQIRQGSNTIRDEVGQGSLNGHGANR